MTDSSNGGARVLTVTGMTCGGCAATVQRVLSRVPGVTAAEVDRPAGRVTVQGTASTGDLVAAVERAGFGAAPAEDRATGGA